MPDTLRAVVSEGLNSFVLAVFDRLSQSHTPADTLLSPLSAICMKNYIRSKKPGLPAGSADMRSTGTQERERATPNMKEKESPGSWVGRDKHVYQKLLQ